MNSAKKAIRHVLFHMKKGHYYRWDLGYNNIIDWSGVCKRVNFNGK